MLLGMELIDLHFDKGNGAIFKVQFEDELVKCFVSQDNAYLSEKQKNSLHEPKWDRSIQKSFPDIFNEHSEVILLATQLSITENGVSEDIWGNLIESSYMYQAESQHNKTFKRTNNSWLLLLRRLF